MGQDLHVPITLRTGGDKRLGVDPSRAANLLSRIGLVGGYGSIVRVDGGRRDVELITRRA